MGTFAQWRLWVGITLNDISKAQLKGEAQAFFDTILDSYEPMEREGIFIDSVGMYGEKVGIGIIIAELNWEVEINNHNVFEPAMVTDAQEKQSILRTIFDSMAISLEVQIYHHIDLGG